jgi:hypothetical protein
MRLIELHDHFYRYKKLLMMYLWKKYIIEKQWMNSIDQ